MVCIKITIVSCYSGICEFSTSKLNIFIFRKTYAK